MYTYIQGLFQLLTSLTYPPSSKKGREEYVTCSDSIHFTNIYITLQRIPVPLWEGKPPKSLDLQ